MYIDHFGLTKKPFQITSDPTFLWLGEKHKEGLATLRYGIQDNRGFLLLTGEVGTGKTILVNKLISLLDNHTIVATLTDPELHAMDFYKLLANSLKMDRPFLTKAEFLIQFREFLHQCYATQRQVLLIIDESQRLTHRLMEEIRVLSNIELQDRKLINIFFVGQPEFNGMLMTPENRALSQRITVRYNVDGLDEQETYDYITHRMKVAGCKNPVFKKDALNEIFLFSGGIPRLINIVCDHALLTAFSKNLKQIDAPIIRECAEELRIPIEKVQSEVATLKTEEEAYSKVDAIPAPRPSASAHDTNKNPGILLKIWKAISLPAMPMRWKLLYYSGILLLLIALVIALSHRADAPVRRSGGTDVVPMEKRTPQENQKGGQSNELPPETPKPDDPRPGGAIPVEDGAGEKTAAVEMKPETPPPTEADAFEEIEIGPLPLMREKVVILFDFNSNKFEDGSYAVLNRIADHLAENPGHRIAIKGYTDSSGNAGYNETVSAFRANAVKSYLIAKGVNPDHMTVHALGAANPVASNETDSGRRKNRRVEIEFENAQ
jgi:general secretion pathway protein A